VGAALEQPEPLVGHGLERQHDGVELLRDTGVLTVLQ
jgi:hypothetical protein